MNWRSISGRIALLLMVVAAPAFGWNRIETYGDSLTAGFFSHTQLTNAPALPILGEMVSDLAKYILTKDTQFLKPHIHPEFAWPVHLRSNLTTEMIPIWNQAIPGSLVNALLEQVTVTPVPDPHQTTVAYFFIGHNDFCHKLAEPSQMADAFEAEFIKALKVWDSQHQNSTAYLMPVADVPKVFESLDGYDWFKNSNTRYSCKDSWTVLFPYCSAHYFRHREGKLRPLLQPRLEAVNGRIRSIAEEWNAASQSNHFVYIDPLTRLSFEPDYFAIDCYHLSELGQTMLAQNIATEMKLY